MLEYTIIEPEGIVVLNPNASLTREDFTGLSTTVDAYLASHSNRHGRLGNIATPNLAFRGRNTRNQPKILPAVLAGIVIWRGFARHDWTDC